MTGDVLINLERLCNDLAEADRKLLAAKIAHSDAYSAPVIEEGARERACKVRDAAEAYRGERHRALYAALTVEVVVDLVQRAGQAVKR